MPSIAPVLVLGSTGKTGRRIVTAAAARAGVKHLVLLSGRGKYHAERCENVVRNSGLDFTLLRASWFAQNFSEGQLLGPVLSGTLALPAGYVHESSREASAGRGDASDRRVASRGSVDTCLLQLCRGGRQLNARIADTLAGAQPDFVDVRALRTQHFDVSTQGFTIDRCFLSCRPAAAAGASPGLAARRAAPGGGSSKSSHRATVGRTGS